MFAPEMSWAITFIYCPKLHIFVYKVQYSSSGLRKYLSKLFIPLQQNFGTQTRSALCKILLRTKLHAPEPSPWSRRYALHEIDTVVIVSH